MAGVSGVQESRLERIIMYLVAALIVLAGVFSLASIFVDDFRADGSTIVTIILGALTTMASILAGGYIAREQLSKKDSVDKEDDPE